MNNKPTVQVIASLPVNEVKVIDKVIDVYLWISDDLNTAEVQSVGQHLIDLANRRATDVESTYVRNRIIMEQYNEPEHEPAV